jgi:hypothetical protein
MLLDESCESTELCEYEPGLGAEFIIPEIRTTRFEKSHEQKHIHGNLT